MAKATDAVYGVELPLTAKLLREFLYNMFYVTDHTTHFYALGTPIENRCLCIRTMNVSEWSANFTPSLDRPDCYTEEIVAW